MKTLLGIVIALTCCLVARGRHAPAMDEIFKIRLQPDLTAVAEPERPATVELCAKILRARSKNRGLAVQVEIVQEDLELRYGPADKSSLETLLPSLLVRGDLDMPLVANSIPGKLDVEAEKKRLGEALAKKTAPLSNGELRAFDVKLDDDKVARWLPLRDKSAAQDAAVPYVLVEFDPAHRFTADDLERVFQTVDTSGRPALGFHLKEASGKRFKEFTGAAMNRQLAIVADGEVVSTPMLTSPIESAGVIEGGPRGFKTEELKTLISAFAFGSLPVRIARADKP